MHNKVKDINATNIKETLINFDEYTIYKVHIIN